jgi:hypothetical protein
MSLPLSARIDFRRDQGLAALGSGRDCRRGVNGAGL